LKIQFFFKTVSQEKQIVILTLSEMQFLFKKLIQNPIIINPLMVILSKTELSNRTNALLYPHQRKQVIKMLLSLLDRRIVLDNTHTGIGKSFHALGCALEIEYSVIIFCLKVNIPSWRDACKLFGVKPLLIVNYDTARNGKMYTDDTCSVRKQSPYFKLRKRPENHAMWEKYKWDLPPKTILIFDEAHRCKKTNTDNGKFLMSTYDVIRRGVPVIMLSATISDKYIDMRIPLFLFGLIDQPNNLNTYMKRYLAVGLRPDDYCMKIHDIINGKFAHRVKLEDVKDILPENNIVIQHYWSENAQKIDKLYRQFEALKSKSGKKPGAVLVELQKIKMKIELLKVPIFVEEAKNYMEKGCAVIVVVTYKKSFRKLVEELDPQCYINGDTKDEDREIMMKKFRKDKTNLFIIQIQTGSTGISLHGAKQRVTLIGIPDKASDFIQAIGRAPRVGGNMLVLTKVVFINNVPYEERMKEILTKKLQDISTLNDRVKDGFKMVENVKE
jgi:superfamily II DNA or RNA helicase